MANKRASRGKAAGNGAPQAPAASEVHRLRSAALAGMRDAIWGSTLGWLYLSGKLTSSQFTAGLRWASLATQFASSVQAPSGARSAKLERTGGTPVDPDTQEGRQEAARHESAALEYAGAVNMLNLAGELPKAAVRHVCEQNLMPRGAKELDGLVMGLHVLASYWSGRKQK